MKLKGKARQWQFIIAPKKHHQQNAGKKGGRSGNITKAQKLEQILERIKAKRNER